MVYLGQEHLASAKEVAHNVHAVHQRAFNNAEGALLEQACFFHILCDVLVDAFNQRVRQPSAHLQPHTRE